MVVTAVAVTLSVPMSEAAVACPPSRYRSAPTKVIAHASGDYFGPPNTIEMLRAAKKAGADILDVDIHVTSDGELVASHDDLINVAPAGAKPKTLSISESTAATVAAINLGPTWPGPKNNYPLARKQVRVPTVEAVLNAFPKDTISLEFKVTGGEQQLCDLLRQTKRTRDVYVGSAGDAAVDRFKPLCPEVTTTVTDAMVVVMRRVRESGEPWCAPVLIGQPPLRTGSFSLSAEYVKWNHDHGLAVFTWTADDEATLKWVATLGVDAVYTARPDLAKKIFNARR
jgi:glycerophosphoryl diester phosphodiesterase